MQHGFDYATILTASHKANWQIEDLIGAGRSLDFNKPFLPENLARVQDLDFLDTAEKRQLNQIRAHSYLYLFGVIEEFILPFLLDHIRARPAENDIETRALLGFAAEEAKHIDLFKRIRSLFQEGFDSPCEVIGPPEAIARHVLSHDPLAVALIILHVEWMTQRHYLDSVRDDAALDRCFADLLKHHWMEEAQHAKLDALMVEELARHSLPVQIDAAIEGYLAIVDFLAGGLRQQVEFDIASLEIVAGRHFDDAKWQTLRTRQQAAMYWTFIGSGMTHATFRGIVADIDPAGAIRIQAAASSYC